MNNLVILTGPTAVGKTNLSIKLAQAIGGEIISADCMQVYKYMDIGTAKIRADEMDGVPHHLIDCMDPSEEFNVVEFVTRAKDAMQGIYERGHIPIICGGTGFYIQALLYDVDFTKGAEDKALREELASFAKMNGALALHEMLKEVDEESANSIPAANVKRVIRAIEYYRLTGQTFSEYNRLQSERNAVYNFCYFVLNDNRDILYNRIDKRVDIMMEDGLLQEINELLDKGYTRDMNSMTGIGYKEMLDYIDGEATLEEAIDKIKQNSRHYAKRQLTWFRREKEVYWLDKQKLKSDDEILAVMLGELKNRGII